MINYTGAKGSTQAPAAAPAAGAAPILSLPVDLIDPDSVTTLAQAFKVLADYANFEQGPTANPSVWAQKIRQFFDAKGNPRWGIDHWGMPIHQLIEWTETFMPGSAFSSSTAGTYDVGRWRIVSIGTASGTASFSPDILHTTPPAIAGTRSPATSRQFYMVIDGANALNRSELRLSDSDSVSAVFTDTTLVAIEWDVSPVTLSDVLWVIGTTSYSQPISNIQDGCFFIRPAGAGQTWHARASIGGVWTDVDTGILADTTNRVLRIELVGSSIADDSAAHALFYVDGVLKANITTNLPVNNHIPVIPILGGVVQAGGVNAFAIMLCNSIRYSQITRIATP
jgi:hypothetical protein